jgi:hypothetical protein
MTSSRQRAANRLNALRSTGPRTALGKSNSSVNSIRHGLTVPVELSYWAVNLQPMTEMLLSEGLSETEARQLALSILDYERNLEHQRRLFMLHKAPGSFDIDLETLSQERHYYPWFEQYGVMDQEGHYIGFGIPMAKIIRKMLREFVRGRVRDARQGVQESWRELRHQDRHLRRAANQLIRRCRTWLGDQVQ